MTTISSSKTVFQQMISAVGLLQTREIMSAWAGLKVARIGVKPHLLEVTLSHLSKLSLKYHVMPDLVFTKRDIGKGGWSNSFDERKGLPRSKGDHLIYISKDAGALAIAVKAELMGKEGDFGSSLGIPECCVRFYLDNLEEASRKQNDFVTLVYRNTLQNHSFNFWNNYVSQYFGYSFLSFFPCTFNCSKAAKFSQNTCELMRSILPEAADKTIYFQKQPILFTEYRGIFLFENAKVNDGKITVSNSIMHSTLGPRSKTLQWVSKVKAIEVMSKEMVAFYGKQSKKTVIKDENMAMCTFK